MMRTSGSEATVIGFAGGLGIPTSSPRLRGEVLGMPLTKGDLAVLAALASTGDVRQAAATLGIAYQTARNRLGDLYAKIGAHGAIGAFWALGWLRVPVDIAL